MRTNILLMLITITISMSFNACAIKNIRDSRDFSESVSTISEEFNNYITNNDKAGTIVLTSMVDVNNFKQSSNFGRLYSDSLLTNLQRSGWNIIDYRGVKLSTNPREGEFYLSRKSLKKLPQDSNYVVGTYGVYGDKLLINVRILKANSNEVIVASNSIITDPDIIAMALKDHCKSLTCPQFSISLIKDDCKNPNICLKKGSKQWRTH